MQLTSYITRFRKSTQKAQFDDIEVSINFDWDRVTIVEPDSTDSMEALVSDIDTRLNLEAERQQAMLDEWLADQRQVEMAELVFADAEYQLAQLERSAVCLKEEMTETASGIPVWNDYRYGVDVYDNFLELCSLAEQALADLRWSEEILGVL